MIDKFKNKLKNKIEPIKVKFLFLLNRINSRLLKVFAVLLILAAIPLTVVIAQQQQDLRQRAAEIITPPSIPTPTSSRDKVCAVYFRAVGSTRMTQGSWADDPKITNSIKTCYDYLKNNIFNKPNCVQPNGEYATGVLMPKSRFTFDMPSVNMSTEFVASQDCPKPSSTPTPLSAKRVFVTSTTYNGNLGDFGGADANCQARAFAANLGGKWKAWISSNYDPVASRFTKFNGPYKLLNGKIIANNWLDLTDGSLQNPININEFGNTINNSYDSSVWTGTKSNGEKMDSSIGLPRNCGNWLVSWRSGGGVGSSRALDARWTGTEQYYDLCESRKPLYCFEQ